MNNLEEMETFLEMDNLPRLNQEEIKKNVNRSLTSNETESVILKNSQGKKKKSMTMITYQMNSNKHLKN